MSEKKPNTPAEFTVQSQDIADDELDTVAGGVSDKIDGVAVVPIVARTYF